MPYKIGPVPAKRPLSGWPLEYNKRKPLKAVKTNPPPPCSDWQVNPRKPIEAYQKLRILPESATSGQKVHTDNFPQNSKAKSLKPAQESHPLHIETKVNPTQLRNWNEEVRSW